MLKIKDNVDLKELEKFGFKYREAQRLDGECYFKEYDGEEITISINGYIHCEDTSGSYNFGAFVEYSLDTIYDLIKADLVKKVGDR